MPKICLIYTSEEATVWLVVLYLPTRNDSQIYALLAHPPTPISYVVWLREFLR